jgi:hypothetical protein
MASRPGREADHSALGRLHGLRLRPPHALRELSRRPLLAVPQAMSDFETPSVARMYCPACEPEADPAREILDVRYCASHSPAAAGLDDGAVTAAQAWISGSSEAGGEDNRRWCELFHRPRASAIALLLLLAAAAGCATKLPTYACFPARTEDGQPAMLCAPLKGR